MRTRPFTLSVAALALLLAACEEDVQVPVALPVAAVSITPSAVELVAGQTTTLAAAVLAADGSQLTGRTVTWSSEDETVARVSDTGIVTALSTGVTRIAGSSAGRIGRTTVTVGPARLVSLEIPGDSVRALERGASTVLTLVGRRSDGTPLFNANPDWTTSDESVAWVSTSGGIVARRGGSAVITASIEGLSARVRIRVPAVERVEISPHFGTIDMGATGQATASVVTEAGPRTVPVLWASDRPDIVRIDAQGRLTPVRPGVTIIRATAEGVTGRTVVTVSGERAPLRLSRADGAALPKTLHSVTVRDTAGALHRVQLELVAGSVARTETGRYTQTLVIYLEKDGALFGVRTYEDAGTVEYDVWTGNPALRSERYPGLLIRGEWEYEAGLQTGSLILMQHVEGSEQPVRLLFRQ